MSKARNTGVARARGKFIAFLEAGTKWNPAYLESLCARLECESKLGVTFARARVFNDDGSPVSKLTQGKATGIALVDLIAANPSVSCSNLVVRREVFYDAGDFPVGLHHVEDRLWLLRVHRAGWKIEGVDRVLLETHVPAGDSTFDPDADMASWDVLANIARTELGDSIIPILRQARAQYLRALRPALSGLRQSRRQQGILRRRDRLPASASAAPAPGRPAGVMT